MKNLAQITSIVREYLDEAAATVEQPILDSVNYLSNIFSIDSIDETQSTVVGEKTLDLPTDSLVVDTIFLDGDEVRQLKNLNDLDNVNSMEVQRWYEFGGKIQFTEIFEKVVATKIFYKKGYKAPATAVATDVPARLLELVYLGAQYRYYNKLITQVALGRDNMPDVKPDELRQIRDDLKKTYFETIKNIQING